MNKAEIILWLRRFKYDWGIGFTRPNIEDVRP